MGLRKYTVDAGTVSGFAEVLAGRISPKVVASNMLAG